MHAHLEKIAFKEVRISLSSNIDWEDGESRIKLTSSNDECPPLTKIFSAFYFLGWYNVLS